MPEPSPFSRIWASLTGNATNPTPNLTSDNPTDETPDPLIPPPGLTLMHTLQGHTNSVYSVAWSPDGSRLAPCSSDRTIRLWDPTSARLLSTLKGHTSSVFSLAWSPDGSLLASASSTYSSQQNKYIDGEVRIWHSDTLEPVAVLTGLQSAGMVTWHPRQPLLATGGTRRQDIMI